MTELVTAETMAEYEEFLAAQPQGSYLQSAQWARQNPELRWRAIVRRNQYGRITGSLALLVERSPLLGLTMLRSCRGPVCSAWDRQTARELLEAVKRLAKREKAYLVRLEPPVPEAELRFSALARELRFREKKRDEEKRGALPRRSWVIELGGHSPERTLRDLEYRCARELRIAVTRGVRVCSGGRELTEDFAVLMQQIALRDGKLAENAEYYAGLLANFEGRAVICMAYLDNRPVSGALAVGYGQRCVCVCEADEGDPTLRARVPLRLELIRQALRFGCAYCEFPGDTAGGFSEGGLFGGGELIYARALELVRSPLKRLLARLGAWLRRRLRQTAFLLRER